MSTSTARAWRECPLVLSCELTAVRQGPTARSMPPIHHSTLTFTVRELLRGDGFAVGSQLVVSHSARQLEPPAYPAVGAPCLLGAVKQAARGMVMPGGGGGAPDSLSRVSASAAAAAANLSDKPPKTLSLNCVHGSGLGSGGAGGHLVLGGS